MTAHVVGARPAEFSASVVMTRAQRVILSCLGVLVAAGIVFAWQATATAALGAAASYFVLSTGDKLWLLLRGIRGGAMITVGDAEARAIPDDELPNYTVLLPVFDEPEIVTTLVQGVGQIDYPRTKLEILLVLEADDTATIDAFHASDVDWIVPVLVPPSRPRTKPKACNHALTEGARDAEFITIYDAEDIPDPLQLRRVVAAFRRLGPEVSTVQARLGYFNETDNLLTKWFAIEYDQWFSYMLPALSQSGCVVPLGGTSNHIRAAALRAAGGWDAFNVTEDADLGVLLARHGTRTAVLDSLTLEEANADPLNWIRQRSRWYKGYVQTFLVHFRKPGQLYREIGFRATARLANTTLGMPVSCLLNLLFWALIIVWYVGKPAQMAPLFSGPIYYMCLLLFTVGNAATILVGLISVIAQRKPYLAFAALLVPGYWLLQAIAATKAFLQLMYDPFYWEKTVHGLSAHQKGSS